MSINEEEFIEEEDGIEINDDELLSLRDEELEKKKKRARDLASKMRKSMGKYEPIIITKNNVPKRASELNEQEQIDEIVRCKSNPVYFIETYLTVFDQTQGDGGKIVPFILFPMQRRLVLSYFNKNNRFHIANKYRQAGISTTTCAFLAWYVMFNPNRTAVIVANKLGNARDELMDDVTNFIESCPDYIRPRPTKKDTQALKRYDNGSSIGAVSAKSGLRSLTPTMVFWDETAHTEGADKFWTAAKPTLQTGGSAILVSTPAGYDKVFFKTFDNARKKLNNFIAVELWWFNDPRYNKSLTWTRHRGKENEIRINDDDFDDFKRIKLMEDGWEATSPWFEAQIKDANYDMKKINQEILCVKSDTIVNIKNKITGEIENIEIEELYSIIRSTAQCTLNPIINNNFLILNSSNEYVEFKGIAKSNKEFAYKVTLVDGKSIIVSEDHMFLGGNKAVSVKSLTPMVSYITTKEDDVFIKSIEIVDGGEFYDIIDSLDSEFFGNDILNHNCSFLGSGDNFIAEQYVQRIEEYELLKPIKEEYVDLQMWIWEDPIGTEEYLMTLDAASGHGDDFTTINIFKKTEFTTEKNVNINGVIKRKKQITNKLEQIAEYYGKLAPLEAGKLAYTYGIKYNYAYCSVDITGGYGGQAVSALMELGYENIHYSEVQHKASRESLSGYAKTGTKTMPDGSTIEVDLIPGFFIGSNRPNILLEAQRAIHMQDVIIRSPRLLGEIKTLVTVSGGRVADHRKSFHDDSFMGLAITTYIVNYEMSKFKNDSNKMKKLLNALSNINGDREDKVAVKKLEQSRQARNPYGANAWVMGAFRR